MAAPSDQQSYRSSWATIAGQMEDALYSRHAVRVVWGMTACATIAYLMGGLPEAAEGLLLAAAIVVHATGWLLRELLATSVSSTSGLVAVAAAGAVLTVSMGPALATLSPGEPIVTGSFTEAGQAVELTNDAAGASRLLVHGAIAADAGKSRVHFTLEAGEQRVRGELDRTMVRTRVGRRGRTRVPHDHDTVFLEGQLPPNAHQIRVTRLDGPLLGPLELRVFRQQLGFWHWTLLVLGVAAFVAALQIRRSFDVRATFAACGALTFGLLVYRWTTPAAAVGAEVGAFLVAGVVAAGVTAAVTRLGNALRGSARA